MLEEAQDLGAEKRHPSQGIPLRVETGTHRRRHVAGPDGRPEQDEIAVLQLVKQRQYLGRCAIIEQARKLSADLIVMGTHGRRGLRRLTLGSDAEMVLRSSPVPVLMVRDVAEPA